MVQLDGSSWTDMSRWPFSVKALIKLAKGDLCEARIAIWLVQLLYARAPPKPRRCRNRGGVHLDKPSISDGKSQVICGKTTGCLFGETWSVCWASFGMAETVTVPMIRYIILGMGFNRQTAVGSLHGSEKVSFVKTSVALEQQPVQDTREIIGSLLVLGPAFAGTTRNMFPKPLLQRVTGQCWVWLVTISDCLR